MIARNSTQPAQRLRHQELRPPPLINRAYYPLHSSPTPAFKQPYHNELAFTAVEV